MNIGDTFECNGKTYEVIDNWPSTYDNFSHYLVMDEAGKLRIWYQHIDYPKRDFGFCTFTACDV